MERFSADSDDVTIERIGRAIRTVTDIDQDTAGEWQASLVAAVGDLDPSSEARSSRATRIIRCEG